MLSINGREIGSGTGGDVMAIPLNALASFADKLARRYSAPAQHDRDDRKHGPDPIIRV